MKLSLDYRRIAVRPFPLTKEMQRIIEECMKNLQDGLIRSQSQPLNAELIRLKEKGMILYDNLVETKDETFYLKVILKHKKGVWDCTGNASSSDRGFEEEKSVGGMSIINLYRDLKEFLVPWKGLYLLDIKVTLHHELIHVFDPKVVRPELQKKWPNYKPGENREKYYKNPGEVSAYEGEMYYYFKDMAKINKPLQKAVQDFLRYNYTAAGRGYAKLIKEDKIRWRKFMERIYKAAQQAYSDFAKEKETVNG